MLALWSGLGYYRRARMLHKAAKTIVSEQREKCRHAAELRKLPGIGSYTAAAIASIAHGEPVAVVDGNVERVLSRIRDGSRTTRSEKLLFGAKWRNLRQHLSIRDGRATSTRPSWNLARRFARHAIRNAWSVRGNGMPHAWRTQDAETRAMTSREIACALVVRDGEAGVGFFSSNARGQHRDAGMWELPALAIVTHPTSKKT